ncbi:iron-regulated membrane protein [Steroidobacter denitrificans]|uniref:Iron-regulated membrane protein n=1 Tax=Steroidobacter denitrificans TaxID=465721 RepID=A0A127FER7_STEDE|nr:PepSY-associated TM helix domain-containing protein [Steroidobacter denitrificans]AMN48401.1 iron-regulated membrane protein [Steroidobacter denitrificans]
MKIGSDVIKVYKDVHIWIGIICGLLLFIAFYAGAITLFEKPLERWATPPSALAKAPPLKDAERLLAAVLAAYPEAANRYSIVVAPTPDQPARVTWAKRGERPRQLIEYGASFSSDGSLQVEKLRKAEVAQRVDRMHQFVGLPLPDDIARIIMGAVALAYAVALLSGLIVLLPTLAEDVFALRIGKNLKRTWLDTHNALGIFSLPFHLMIALTSVVFAFHTPFYATQAKALYGGQIDWGEHEPPPTGITPLSASELLARANTQLSGFEVYRFDFQKNRDGLLETGIIGLDIRRGARGRTYMRTHVDPYTGRIDTHDLPGHMDGWNEAVNAFFALHFGSYGGNAVRWLYLLMGLAGAALFYTGNLLWMESRRKKQRGSVPVVQERSARVLAELTVGIAFGSIAGISTTIAAAKWLPAQVEDLAFWHDTIYYAVFFASVGWALRRGAARSARELLWLCALATLLIPLSSLAGVWGIGGAWNHPGTTAIDLTALIAAPVFLLIAQHARRRACMGHTDSVWSVALAADAGAQSP